MQILERIPFLGLLLHNRAMPPGYVTVHQAAAILRCNEQQVRDMIRAGLIKPEDREQIGRAWLIRKAALKGLEPRKKGRPKGTTKR